MTTANQVLLIANAEKGYTEGPNNANKYGDWYGDPNVSWCAQFVSWVGAMAAEKFNSSNPFLTGPNATKKGYEYTPTWANDFKAAGKWSTNDTTIKVGDIVFFDRINAGRISHVGIVESVSKTGYVTVEGNTFMSGYSGGKVGNHTIGYGNSKYRGHGTPNYTAKATAPKPTPTPPKTTTYPLPPPYYYGVWNEPSASKPRAVGPYSRSGDTEHGGRASDQPVVKRIQKLVGATVDGIYGPATKRAVIAWQRANGLAADGKFGPASWEKSGL